MRKVLSLAEVQSLELEMLIAFNEVCDKNGLYYTLCGGTLLGAVRHQGFIPWDDDIDVMMPRPYFEKLCDLIKSDSIVLPEGLRAVSWFSDPSVDIPFVKIINDRTTVSEKYMDSDRHLWIDVFVMDGCPENMIKLNRMFKKQRWLRNVLVAKQTKPGTGKTRTKVLIKTILRFLTSLISAKNICISLDKLSKTYEFDNSEYVGCIQWGYGPQERVHRVEWMKPLYMSFEGKEFPVPSNYDEYLKGLYGDYMTLPPIEKRTSHDMIVEMR